MAECYLQIGLDETTFPGDVFPMVFRMETLIPATHEHLFRFIDYDLYRLEEPLKEYLSCLHDGSDAEKPLLRRSIMVLRELHPYFMLSSENVQSFLNINFANYIRRFLPGKSTAEQRAMFTKVALRRFSVDADPDEFFPADEKSGPMDDGIGPMDDTHGTVGTLGSTNTEGSVAPDSLVAADAMVDAGGQKAAPHRGQYILADLFGIQQSIRRLVFTTLDDTSEALAGLSTPRRTALYSLAYSADSLAYIKADFGVAPSDKMRKEILKLDFDVLPDEEDETDSEQHQGRRSKYDGLDSYEVLRKSLDELYWNPDAPLAPALREVILATDDVLDPTRVTYEVDSFSGLLNLEVYRMIAEEARIRRCKRCHRYFVSGNDGQEFCGRPECAEDRGGHDNGTGREGSTGRTGSKLRAKTSKQADKANTTHGGADTAPEPEKGESAAQVPVSEKKRTKKSESPSYNLYRSKYKALGARVKAGTMTAEEYHEWKQIALGKLDDVLTGKLDAADYDEWLKS